MHLARLSAEYLVFLDLAIVHSFRLLPCFPFQNEQYERSPPCGKSKPSSCGQPMLPSAMARRPHDLHHRPGRPTPRSHLRRRRPSADRKMACDAEGHLLTEKWYDAAGNLTETLAYTYDADGHMLTAAN